MTNTPDTESDAAALDQTLRDILRPDIDSFYANNIGVAVRDDEFVLCFGLESIGQGKPYERRVFMTRASAKKLASLLMNYIDLDEGGDSLL
ncbi:hypothetical protein F1188_11300 [Roseospira marina]|uniref:Uncharacterized protein n=1 Tax=Roseospira marina TaxID=140057 RepID=A0A5M6IB01_9PROT|nr:hypothetical protein [Roseospira marina]KAA5605474.1 hypothetical protein F1188_11300 [Roseospira marina]MBB4314524.1 hypothetical protein [Roseospira marina]MBB5088648.1 hypothetical protein [Roseospira marina]